jgi:hypothetical protein
MRTATVGLAPLPLSHATLDETSVFGFKDGQAGAEQVAVGHNDDIEARGDLVASENLTYQSFGAISVNRATKLLGRRDAEAPDPGIGGEDERRAVAAADPKAALVHALEVGATADPLGSAQPHLLVTNR